MEKTDIAIIGNGPAGISAALTAKVRNCDFKIFGNKDVSRKLDLAKKIENYPGEYNISGHQLIEKYQKQLDLMGIVVNEERINNVYCSNDYFLLLTDKNEYQAKAVILAGGAPNGKLIEGEKDYLGKGVSYCATCDGNLYKNKIIAVICDDKSLEEEVEYLAGLAQKVYYYSAYKTDLHLPNVNISTKKIQRIVGEKFVDGIISDDGSMLKVDGVFILRSVVNADSLVYGLKTVNGNVVVDRNMATDIAGLFACGDITGRPYQIVKALGEGNVAIHSAISYLNKK
ncbi:MAG: NAD(P)/FAD-dependent oxidoreductase [Erysipelotrichia bacterium]|nr:NAD(P)/FAD-dependent oxidoreductase [Erysipelotrichia bacterium]